MRGDQIFSMKHDVYSTWLLNSTNFMSTDVADPSRTGNKDLKVAPSTSHALVLHTVCCRIYEVGIERAPYGYLRLNNSNRDDEK